MDVWLNLIYAKKCGAWYDGPRTVREDVMEKVTNEENLLIVFGVSTVVDRESGGLDVLAEEAMTDLLVDDIALGGEGGLDGDVGVGSLVGHIMVLHSEQSL